VSPESAFQERFLEPGAIAFGDSSMRIRTLLGSCVAVTFWHPKFKIGAMCHFLLPKRPGKVEGPADGRYAEDAIATITEWFRNRGVAPEALEVKVFGGGNMFPETPVMPDIGRRNAQDGLRLLEEAGFRILQRDLTGEEPRMVVFDILSGDVWVRRPRKTTVSEPLRRQP